MGEGLVTVLVAQHSRRPAFQCPRAPGNGGGAVTTTGLDFAGNVNHPAVSPSVMAVWRDGVSTAPPAWGDMVFYQRVMPRSGQPGGYWSGLFYAQWQTSWNPAGLLYFGSHPYPVNHDEQDPYAWEISKGGADLYDNNSGSSSYGNIDALGGYDIFKDQITVVKEGVGVFFFWNAPDWTKYLFAEDSGSYTTEPTDPAIIIGDAPWNAGYENYKGVIARMAVYTGAPSLVSASPTGSLGAGNATAMDAIGAAVIAGTLSGAPYAKWYENRALTPDDITDKSGNGNDPAWVNANRPALWEG